MVEERWNDALVGILLDEVASIRDPCHRGMRERAQPQLVEHSRCEGGILHAPGDADWLVAEEACEAVFELAPELRDGVARAGRDLSQEHEHAGAARCGWVRREVGTLAFGGHSVTVLDAELEEEEATDEVEPLHQE